MLQWNDCRFTTWIRIKPINQPRKHPTSSPARAGQRALGCEHRADLQARHADVPEHAELASARQHLARQTARESEQTDADGGRLQRVGHGERAVEDPQAQAADLAGLRELHALASRQLRAHSRFDLLRRDTRLQP